MTESKYKEPKINWKYFGMTSEAVACIRTLHNLKKKYKWKMSKEKYKKCEHIIPQIFEALRQGALQDLTDEFHEGLERVSAYMCICVLHLSDRSETQMS